LDRLTWICRIFVMSTEVYYAAVILSSSGFKNDTTRASDRINWKMREYRRK
jgi:hypothetical protein